MVRNEILAKLAPLSEEEEALCNSGGLDRSLYMEKGSCVIESRRMMAAGKMMDVRTHTRFTDFPLHSHDYVEVVYVCSGSVTHIVEGERVVLAEGELLFLSLAARHEILRAEKNDVAINFMILPRFFTEVLTMLGEEETPLKRFIIGALSRKEEGVHYLHFRVADVFSVQNLVENLLYAYLFDMPNKRKVNQYTMGLLLLQLMNHSDRLHLEKGERAVLFRVLRYIEERYADGSLGELCEILHYDISTLSRYLKQATGKTYTRLLQEKRLSQAQFLLRSSQMNVDQIAAAVGYENASYFHRLFTREIGMRPKAYRDENKDSFFIK